MHPVTKELVSSNISKAYVFSPCMNIERMFLSQKLAVSMSNPGLLLKHSFLGGVPKPKTETQILSKVLLE